MRRQVTTLALAVLVTAIGFLQVPSAAVQAQPEVRPGRRDARHRRRRLDERHGHRREVHRARWRAGRQVRDRADGRRQLRPRRQARRIQGGRGHPLLGRARPQECEHAAHARPEGGRHRGVRRPPAATPRRCGSTAVASGTSSTRTPTPERTVSSTTCSSAAASSAAARPAPRSRATTWCAATRRARTS